MSCEELICEIAAAKLTASSKVAILRLAAARKAMTTYEIMDALGIGRRQVHRAFDYPIALGLVVKHMGCGGRKPSPSTYEFVTRRAQTRRDEERRSA